MRQDQRDKARERSRRWREARRNTRVPESRQIDRAIAAGIIHIVLADRARDRILPQEIMSELAKVAAFILEEGYDRGGAHEAVEERMRALGKSLEVGRARERQSLKSAYAVR
ncbi:hypothetical protein VQ042_24030 [Aurantimonas sp. A2-1-M11]|uniref:hypothetical protein n=1 Tax=Aurantimonas sp. A2-1-M11 TaxID=3113712 RepID=UPI002F9312BE